MLNGLYGLIFGAETMVDGVQLSTSGNGDIQATSSINDAKNKIKNKGIEAEWCLIDEDASSVAPSDYESVHQIMDECRSLASEDDVEEAGRKGSAGALKKTLAQMEWERQAVIRGTERNLLAQALFSDQEKLQKVSTITIPNDGGSPIITRNNNNTANAARLKRAAKAEMASNVQKTRARSKKSAGQKNSNRNNDRKCNNITELCKA